MPVHQLQLQRQALRDRDRQVRPEQLPERRHLPQPTGRIPVRVLAPVHWRPMRKSGKGKIIFLIRKCCNLWTV